MKKKQLTAKKTLSVFLAVLMLMTSWVFFPGMFGIEAEAVDAGASVAEYNKQILNGLNTNVTVNLTTTTNNKYQRAGEGDTKTADATPARLAESYRNVLNFNNGNIVNTGTGSAAHFSGVANADSVQVWYPNTVLMYDGATTPKMAILIEIDSNGKELRSESCWFDGATGFTLGVDASNPYWKGSATDDSATMYCLYVSGTGNIATTNGTSGSAAYNHKAWLFSATHLMFTGTMGDTEWVRTFKPTWYFKGGNKSSVQQYSVSSGNVSKTIYVMNVKGYTNFISTIANHKNILLNNAGKYAPEAIRNYVAAAKEITETLHPSNYVSTTSQNVANWASRMSTAYTNYNNAYNNLTNRTVELTYENLFSLADWRNSDSYAYNSSNGEVVIENDATIKIYKSGAGGELTTASSYSGNHKASMYSMPVIGGKDYTVRFNITSSVSGTPTSEVFLFWYDVNNKPVYNTAGSNTFNNKSFNGDGVKTATFTVPANAVKCEIRFDNDSATSASTIRFNDIAFYPAERNTEGEVELWTARPFKKLYTLGSTISGKLDVPARTNYEFVGWYIDSNKNGLLDSGDTKLTDATGTVIASNVKINESTNLVSEWRSLPLDIGYDNLFSLAEWAKTGSNNVNSKATALNVDIMNGTIAVTGKEDAYTIYGGGNTNYTVPVTAGEEYIFTYKVTSTNNTYQAFVFFYNDAGEGVTSSVQNAPHIGVYNGAPITFTAPAGCTKVGFRIGICGSTEGTATYSNIGFYKKAAYDAYAKDYQVIRVPFYVGDTTELKLNPTRAGYTFTGWVDGEGNTITSVAGLKASDTVYATWVQQLKVEFKNYDGTLIDTQYLTPGTAAKEPAAPTKSADENYEYTFAGWDKDFSNVTTDLVVTAKFNNVEHPAETISYTRVTFADCVNPGTIRKSCENCGYAWNNGDAYLDVNGEYVPALGHNYVTVVTDSSTGVNGVHTVACNRANCKYGADGKAATITAAHNFIEDTSNPAASATCTKAGETYYKCACLETKTITGKIDPNNHVNKEIRGASESTCEDKGYTGDTWCKDCNNKIATGTEIKALEHKYTNYVSNGDATCTADGTKTAKCDNNCGKEDTVTDIGSQIPHKYTNYVSNGDAKCGVDGTKTAKCDYNCNVGVDTVTDVGSALEHNFTGAYVTNNNGTHVQKCVNNDCTATGNEKACEYGAWTTDNAATHSHTCEKCNYTPAAEAHTWSAWTTVGGSDTEKATQTRSCTVCGRVENSECRYEVKTHQAATCEADERTTYECLDCKHGYTVIGEVAKGHNFTKEAGVKNNGNSTHSFACANGCGEYGFETTKNMSVPCSDWTYANTEAGKHTATCKVCAYEKTEDCSGGEATCTALAVCAKCSTAYGDFAPHDITGTERYLKKATDATCIANETYYKYCINCESEFSTETYEKPDSKAAHVYECTDEYLYIATQAKCGENETYYAYCTNPDCKKSSEDAANTFEKPNTALTHNYDGTIVTGNNDGTHVITCANTNSDGWTCDATITANCADSALSTGGEEATCISQGYTDYQCTLCSYTWKANYTAALGHDYTQKVYDKAHLKEAANCEHANIYWYDCSRCDKNAKDETDTEKYTTLTFLNGEVREHDWKNVTADDYRAVPATCTAAAKYYPSCAYDDCNAKDTSKTFSSGYALGHDFTEKIQDEAHLISDADCVNGSKYYYDCSRCDENAKNDKESSKYTYTLEDYTGHALTHTPAKDKTCTEDGNLEYWYCSECEKYFKNADATEAYLGLSEITIEATGHKKVTVPYKAATCENDGHPEYTYCEVCEEPGYKGDLTGYEAKGHNFTGDYYCDTVNNYHAQYCVNECCDKVTLTDAEGNAYKVNSFGIVNTEGKQVKYQVTYDELDGNTIVGGVPCTLDSTTETKDGVHTHVINCTVCESNSTAKTYADTETIIATVAPDCTNDGYDDHECPDCDATWKNNIVPRLGHIKAENATSNGDGTHSYICTRDNCGYKVSTENCYGGTATCKDKAVCTACQTAYGKTTDHTYETEWAYQDDATCEADGTEKNTCTVCKETQTRTAAGTKLTHSYSDYYDDKNDLPEGVTIVGFDVDTLKKPTCAEDGYAVSYCTLCFNAFKTKTTPKDKSHHIWETNAAGELVWKDGVGDCSTGITLKNYCTLCGEDQEKEVSADHEWTKILHIEPTCNDNGHRTWKCAVCKFTVEEFYGYRGYELPEPNSDLNKLGDEGHEFIYTSKNKPATCTEAEQEIWKCVHCGKIENRDIDGAQALGHKLNHYNAVEADCVYEGAVEHWNCSRCDATFADKDGDKVLTDVVIPVVPHDDGDGDGKCDECFRVLYSNDDGEGSCGCICHKENFLMKIIYKILNFFWKLFKISRSCECGAVHW